MVVILDISNGSLPEMRKEAKCFSEAKEEGKIFLGNIRMEDEVKMLVLF
ncbi:Uncharacterised protein [Legionella sainthelensi]|nr:hypothetical protein [Legionella sainthelensi]VEB36752.1 Uncharacterised protein [Legionella sainthelensi]